MGKISKWLLAIAFSVIISLGQLFGGQAGQILLVLSIAHHILKEDM